MATGLEKRFFLTDQPVYGGEKRTLEVPYRAPCIPGRAQQPCWEEWVAGQPEEEEVFQSEVCLSEQLWGREHPFIYNRHFT